MDLDKECVDKGSGNMEWGKGICKQRESVDKGRLWVKEINV